MLKQIRTFETAALAFEVTDGFNEEDEKLAQKLFNQKLEKGFTAVNVLIKMDGYKLTQTEFKAFFEDLVFALKNFKKMGHVAIVAHSSVLKAIVPVDNLFFEKTSKDRLERYFDVSELDEAIAFVNQ